MQQITIDEADLRLLDLLQTDASRSNQALAELAHLSPPTSLRRVKRLRALGLIHMEPRCAALAEQLVDLAARVQCALWSDLTYYLEGQLTREDARDAIEAHLAHLVATR